MRRHAPERVAHRIGFGEFVRDTDEHDLVAERLALFGFMLIVALAADVQICHSSGKRAARDERRDRLVDRSRALAAAHHENRAPLERQAEPLQARCGREAFAATRAPEYRFGRICP